jgi:Flp pilus assembly protein TadG
LDFLSPRTMFNTLVRTRSGIGRLLRDTRADTALEFAMIGSALFLFIFGIFVFSLDMFWQMTLDDAVRNAARQVQIGAITNSTEFKDAVCTEFGVTAPNCETNLQYAVQTSSSFGTITPGQLSAAGILSNNGTFVRTMSTELTSTTSAAPEFLLVQVAYLIPLKIFAVPAGVATENGTPALMSAAAAVMQ